MKYMGSKTKIAKEIIPIIQKYIDKNNIECYIEPFCGGANVIDKVVCRTKIASDINKYLIALLKEVDRIDILPNSVTKEHYAEVRKEYRGRNENRQYEDWYIGAIGFLASYNGRFFDGGYAGIVKTKIGTVRNYYEEAKKNLLLQKDNLKGITFMKCDYRKWSGVRDTLIYCDPPYKNVKQYGENKEFNHEEFWKWCEKVSEKNIVIVSEQEAPEGFEVIWKKEVKRTIDNKKGVKATEKLFVYAGGKR